MRAIVIIVVAAWVLIGFVVTLAIASAASKPIPPKPGQLNEEPGPAEASPNGKPGKNQVTNPAES